MSKARVDSLKSLLKLFRFLFWYAAIVAAVLYLLPWAGQQVQSGYEAMSSGARAASVLVFIVAAVARQLAGMRSRDRDPRVPGVTRRTDSS